MPEATRPRIQSFTAFAAAYQPIQPKPGPIIARSGASDVRLRGQALDEILWRGRSWAATRFGVEKRDGSFQIEGNRLREGLPNYSFIQHVAGKNDVDFEDFATAFFVACAMHGIAFAKTDMKALRQHVAEGRGLAARQAKRETAQPAATTKTHELVFQTFDEAVAEAIATPTREPILGPIISQDGRRDVLLRGQRLHPTLWRGETWSVSSFGIERRDGLYAIEADRLRAGLPQRSWVLDIGEKGDFALEDFATAFFAACAMHGVRLSKSEVETILRHLNRQRPYQAANNV